MLFLPKREISTPLDWLYSRYLCFAVAVYLFFLMFWPVLMGDQPFHNTKSTELVHHISNGVHPDKPENPEAIGITTPLWRLIQKCWDGERTRRPRIQDIVAGVGNAAANWHTDMPLGGTEHREEPVSEELSSDSKHGEFLFLIVIFPLHHLCSQNIPGLSECR